MSFDQRELAEAQAKSAKANLEVIENSKLGIMMDAEKRVKRELDTFKLEMRQLQ